MIQQKIDFDEVRNYITSHPNAKIFFGCDSQKISKRKKSKTPTPPKSARFISLVIVYEKDNNKIFAEVSTEKDYDVNPGKPVMRLMNEVYKVSAMVSELSDVLENRKWDVHLDINPRKGEGSHCAFHQAVGYIKGMHGITPIVKPDAWAASCVSDHLCKKGYDKNLSEKIA